ncbi:hypothetical protein BCR34DRAFT_186645 [Clohesyomyces aquaticus]|uniref:Uncharacterized protein n=1 Tax=Clohesyomyces aquaticus TaxID=1231657 RepID=A0A1Y1YD62_9PLEO|nr:hypothetical protein BCR34DRAFT_186645 [Clohesyomyces aquaticus]
MHSRCLEDVADAGAGLELAPARLHRNCTHATHAHGQLHPHRHALCAFDCCPRALGPGWSPRPAPPEPSHDIIPSRWRVDLAGPRLPPLYPLPSAVCRPPSALCPVGT